MDLESLTIHKSTWYRRKAREVKLTMEEKRDLWEKGLVSLRKTWRNAPKAKLVFNHLVAFYQALKDGGWTLEEAMARQQKEAVFEIFWTNWVGGKTSNKSKNFYIGIGKAILDAVAEVWGDFKSADIKARKIPDSQVAESGNEDGEGDDPGYEERCAIVEDLKQEQRDLDKERMRFLENLEARGHLSDEQRGWLEELRKAKANG